MMGDDENPGRVVDDAAAATEQAADTVRSNVSDAAATMQQATASTAQQAEDANRRMTQAATTASQGASRAFSEARERLGSLSAPFGGQAFDTMRQSSEAFGKGFETSYATAFEGMAEFNSKAIAAWRSNAETAIEHWQHLAGTKSLSEAIALNAEMVRKQMETLTSQVRELSSLATKIVRDAADPLKLTNR